MSAQLREALAIWQMRNVRTGGDTAYVAYAVIMVVIVAVAPLVRALWLSATSAEGVALLASATTPTVLSLIVAALWAGALLVGRDRGPALLPPFPLHVLATSDIQRSTVFRGPLLRNGLLVTVSTTAVAGFIGIALVSQGLGDPLTALAFAATGALVGLIATVAWLVGQALPRLAIYTAAGIVVLAGLGVVITNLFVLATIATTLIALVPTLLNRLSLATLTAQAAKWESATVFASGLDFAAATSTYRGRPRIGRRMRAVRPGRSLAMTFLLRDAVGVIRTPGRLIVGISAVAVAGVLMTLALAPAAPTVLLGAAAGLVLFAGLGPLTDGIRHAATVAADLPLYGISDEALLGFHALFPLVIVAVVILLAVLVASALLGIWFGTPLAATLALGATGLVTRVSTALKGMLPPSLLTPIPTPVGDLSIVNQLVWALDGVIVVALAGVAAALMLQAPALLIVVGLVAVGTGVKRWRARA